MKAQKVLEKWPKDSKNVAQQIIDKYGEPDEITDSLLIWYNNGPWKKTIVSKKATEHTFPMPHTDIVEQFIPYNVPTEKVDELTEYDGSVSVKRTEGLLSARCHDEPANFLAINLAHDIVNDKLTVDRAKEKYVQVLKDFRKKKPTPYMEDFQFEVPQKSGDRGMQMITNEELAEAKKEGKKK